VLRFKLKEGQDYSKLFYKEIKNSLGGREGGVTFVEYNKVSYFPLLLNSSPAIILSRPKLHCQTPPSNHTTAKSPAAVCQCARVLILYQENHKLPATHPAGVSRERHHGNRK